jgi:hypothetical protein
MDREQIIEWSREADIDWHKHWNDDESNRLEAFAKLVAAHEREACAKVCEELPAPDIYDNTDKSMWDVTCIDCAEAIRARGNT